MALKTDKSVKRYYSIKEVSQRLDLPESTLRYWETVFPNIQPKKNRAGIRQYKESDMEQLEYVRKLLKERGHTIKSVAELVKRNPQKTFSNIDITTALRGVRDELKSILEELDSIPPCGSRF